jgi:hypothetical protein
MNSTSLTEWNTSLTEWNPIHCIFPMCTTVHIGRAYDPHELEN